MFFFYFYFKSCVRLVWFLKLEVVSFFSGLLVEGVDVFLEVRRNVESFLIFSMYEKYVGVETVWGIIDWRFFFYVYLGVCFLSGVVGN